MTTCGAPGIKQIDTYFCLNRSRLELAGQEDSLEQKRRSVSIRGGVIVLCISGIDTHYLNSHVTACLEPSDQPCAAPAATSKASVDESVPPSLPFLDTDIFLCTKARKGV